MIKGSTSDEPVLLEIVGEVHDARPVSGERSTLTYSSFLGVNSETGQNLDSASILYDSTARPSSATIWELPFSFWQTSFSQMLGTLLHEYGHVAGVNDAQEAAGVHVDMYSGNTSNISDRLARDCFSGVSNP